VLDLAELGVEEAFERNPGLRLGLNVQAGEIMHPAVAAALGAPAGRV
jgi:alanine dehydrogenase